MIINIVSTHLKIQQPAVYLPAQRGQILEYRAPLISKLKLQTSFHMTLSFSSVPPSLPAVNTSCGLPLKTLRRTPMYVCGTYLVMVASAPGVSGSSATRSLFGGTSGLSSLKGRTNPD